MKKLTILALALALSLSVSSTFATTVRASSITGSANSSSEGDDDANDTVVSESGEVIVSSIATSNNTATQVALVTSGDTLNALAGVGAGQGIVLNVENSQCGPLARQAVTSAAISAGGSIASILEIDLQLLNANGIWEGDTVSTLSAPVEFKISAPSDVDAAQYDFALVRLHDGKTTILPDQDNDPSTITFTTDKFSVYAVIYAPKGAFNAYKTSQTGVKDSVPKTGDSLPPALPLSAVACMAVAMVLLKKRTTV